MRRDLSGVDLIGQIAIDDRTCPGRRADRGPVGIKVRPLERDGSSGPRAYMARAVDGAETRVDRRAEEEQAAAGDSVDRRGSKLYL